MPQPYNYNLQSPAVAFVESLQMQQAMQQQQQAQAQQENARQRAQAVQQAIQSAQADPSPQNIAQIYLNVPEAQAQIEAYRNALGEADRGTLLGAAREAIVAGQLEGDVAGVFGRYAQAAENSGRQDLAQQFRDAERVAQTDPAAAALVARQFYHGVDPEGYTSLYGQTTADIQNWQYFSEAVGEDEAKRLLGMNADDIQVLPNGMVIAGPDSALAQSMGGNMAAPNIPTLTPEQFQANRAVLGDRRAAEFTVNNNIPVRVRTSQEAATLPTGTKYITPDGREFVR